MLITTICLHAISCDWTQLFTLQSLLHRLCTMIGDALSKGPSLPLIAMAHSRQQGEDIICCLPGGMKGLHGHHQTCAQRKILFNFVSFVKYTILFCYIRQVTLIRFRIICYFCRVSIFVSFCMYIDLIRYLCMYIYIRDNDSQFGKSFVY